MFLGCFLDVSLAFLWLLSSFFWVESTPEPSSKYLFDTFSTTLNAVTREKSKMAFPLPFSSNVQVDEKGKSI